MNVKTFMVNVDAAPETARNSEISNCRFEFSLFLKYASPQGAHRQTKGYAGNKTANLFLSGDSYSWLWVVYLGKIAYRLAQNIFVTPLRDLGDSWGYGQL